MARNHGEDVKEYWWYLDAIPSHPWDWWRYHYRQGAFPYQDLIDVNARRSRYELEYELPERPRWLMPIFTSRTAWSAGLPAGQ